MNADSIQRNAAKGVTLILREAKLICPVGQVNFRLHFIPARRVSPFNQRASALISGSKLCVQFDTSPRALSPIEAERVNWFAVHYGPVTSTTRKPTSESGQFS
jgi:hypothetical protein